MNTPPPFAPVGGSCFPSLLTVLHPAMEIRDARADGVELACRVAGFARRMVEAHPGFTTPTTALMEKVLG